MTMLDDSRTQDPVGAQPPRHLKQVLALLLVAAFVVVLNETITGVALPQIMGDLDITAATAQWLTSAYLLTMAVVIPTTGLILKRFSTRGVFITAMSLFTVGTLLAAVAPGFPVLITGRVIQASGTAMMLPLLTTTVLTYIPEERRGRTMGLISIVIAGAPAVGPTFSGLVLANLSWRWLFWIVLPIALLALVLGAFLVKNLATPQRVRFDALSIVLSALAFGGLIFGLSSIGESASGHTAIPPVIPIAVGAASLILFVIRQLLLQRTNSTLLDLRPFRSRTFTVGVVVLLIAMGALFGSLITLPIYLQNVLGVSTLQTGLMLLPGGVVVGALAPFIGRAFDRVGPRPLVIPGAVVVTMALGIMTLFDETTTPTLVVVAHVTLNIGLGLLMTPLMTSALGSLDPGLYSHGSALVNTLQQLAGAAGTALFITVMTTATAAATEAGIDAVAAQAQGFHSALLWGAGLAVVAVVASLFVRRPARTPVGISVH